MQQVSARKNVQKTTFEAAEMMLGPWNQQIRQFDFESSCCILLSFWTFYRTFQGQNNFSTARTVFYNVQPRFCTIKLLETEVADFSTTHISSPRGEGGGHFHIEVVGTCLPRGLRFSAKIPKQGQNIDKIPEQACQKLMIFQNRSNASWGSNGCEKQWPRAYLWLHKSFIFPEHVSLFPNIF